MNLLGEATINGVKFWLYIKNLKRESIYYLISKVHKDDLVNYNTGQALNYKLLQNLVSFRDNVNDGYVLESLKKSVITSQIRKFGHGTNLDKILNLIRYAEGFSFHSEDIVSELNETTVSGKEESFMASHPDLFYKYRKLNHEFTYLEMKGLGIEIRLNKCLFRLPSLKLEYQDISSQYETKLQALTIKDITYDILKENLDMSWFEREDGIYVKDYRGIETILDFEFYIITGLVHALQQSISKGEVLDVALDTETTGLNIYELQDSNSLKDHCVAVPISWKEDTGFLIYTDMEFFQNIDNSYVAERLGLFFGNFSEERTITYYEKVNDSFEKFDFTFTRESINLIGHNVMFDSRVFRNSGTPIYFNNDTLQMGFNLNPQTVRGNNKLKRITRVLFGDETPELTDILGKGNEDKFRYLKHRFIANIYGCADADYTLKVFHRLKQMISPTMYIRYQQQDIPLLNILSESEYYGLPVIGDEVKGLAEQIHKNIEILEQLMFSYTGSYIQYIQDLVKIESGKKAGMYATDMEYKQVLANLEFNLNAKYEFKVSGNELRSVLYTILKYPVKYWTDSANPIPQVNKAALKYLAKEEYEDGKANIKSLKHDVLVYGADVNEYNRLKNGSKKEKAKAKSMVLVDAAEFNKKKYPLAIVLLKYAELNKEYTAYYKPIVENNMENRLFKNYNMARIETRRISNPLQTVKANLKALVRSYNDDYYMLDFDMSQIEYRIMVSLANFTVMINKMKDPEKDYHTETAANNNKIPPYRVTKKERKKAKCVSFGNPYGLGEVSLCETLFGDKKPEHLVQTRMLLKTFKENNAPIIELLEKARASAFEVQEVSDDVRTFMDMWKKDENGNYSLDREGNRIKIPIGKVSNAMGFYRLFNLSNIDYSDEAIARRKTGKYTSEEGNIRRKAGNYPIQSLAAEIFRIILIRFYNRCVKEGIADKVKWHMLIHDELLCSVHKSICPALMYKIIKEECMITMLGHTNYYVGINVGSTWAECKDDSREAPIYFVDRMIKRYDLGEFDTISWYDNPWEFIKPYHKEYIRDRIKEVIIEIQPNVMDEPLNVKDLLKSFTNYTVRAYVNDYPLNSEITFEPIANDPDSEERYSNLVWQSSLESWALEVFGEGKEYIDIDGTLRVLHKNQKESEKTKESLYSEFDNFDDFDIEEDSDFEWSFDTGGLSDYITGKVKIVQDDNDFMPIVNENKNAENIADLVVKPPEFSNLSFLNKQILINGLNNMQMKEVQNYLAKYVVKIGYSVVFTTPLGQVIRWNKINETIDKKALDNFIGLVKSNSINKFSNLVICGNKIIIKVPTKQIGNKIKKILDKNTGTWYQTKFQYSDDTIESYVSLKRNIDLEKLNKLVDRLRC